MDRRHHWNTVHTEKTERDVSWFEPLPHLSLQMLDAAGLNARSCVIDVGGGDSRLVDALIARSLTCVAVLDISGAALDRAKQRLGAAADVVTWIEADVAGDWTLQPMDIWHDRAVFHFLVDAADRTRYVSHMREVLKLRGTAVIAAFDITGPEKCSGLPVRRYSAESLARELGDEFRLVDTIPYEHHTPWGATQAFRYSRFIREA